MHFVGNLCRSGASIWKVCRTPKMQLLILKLPPVRLTCTGKMAALTPLLVPFMLEILNTTIGAQKRVCRMVWATWYPPNINWSHHNTSTILSTSVSFSINHVLLLHIDMFHPAMQNTIVHSSDNGSMANTGWFFWLVPPRKVLSMELVPSNSKKWISSSKIEMSLLKKWKFKSKPVRP